MWGWQNKRKHEHFVSSREFVFVSNMPNERFSELGGFKNVVVVSKCVIARTLR